LVKVLYLIRHCETTGQAPDAPLTEAGHRQAADLARRLGDVGIGRVVSSPYARAVQSAEPLAEWLGLPLESDPRLRERALSSASVPDWRERVRASFADPDLCLEGGESGRAATERAAAAIEEVLAHPAAVTAVVTHGNLLALILRHLDARYGFDEYLALTNPDVFRVEAEVGTFAVRRWWTESGGPDA
jgi:2,3-bisphosphoglycerate-dependent phosphoglycerate mutase